MVGAACVVNVLSAENKNIFLIMLHIKKIIFSYNIFEAHAITHRNQELSKITNANGSYDVFEKILESILFK